MGVDRITSCAIRYISYECFYHIQFGLHWVFIFIVVANKIIIFYSNTSSILSVWLLFRLGRCCFHSFSLLTLSSLSLCLSPSTLSDDRQQLEIYDQYGSVELLIWFNGNVHSKDMKGNRHWTFGTFELSMALRHRWCVWSVDKMFHSVSIFHSTQKQRLFLWWMFNVQESKEIVII